jgi:hypothetical protein
VQNGFFELSGSDVPNEYPLKGPAIQKHVPKMLMQVKEKVEDKVREKFEGKLHECFPSFRQLSFQRISAPYTRHPRALGLSLIRSMNCNEIVNVILK